MNNFQKLKFLYHEASRVAVVNKALFDTFTTIVRNHFLKLQSAIENWCGEVIVSNFVV